MKTHLVWFFATSLILLLLFLCGAKRKVRRKSSESYETTVFRVLAPKDSLDIIRNNHEFWNSLDEEEWRKRNVKNLDEYIDLIQHDFVALTTSQYHTLCTACQEVDTILKRCHLPNFDQQTAASIAWNIGVFQGDRYEYGWPHTMENAVFLPLSYITSGDMHELIKTLAHEKIHVYQRLYDDKTQQYLHPLGFEKWRKRDLKDKHIRPNPDLDGWIYKCRGEVFGLDMITHIPTPDSNPQFYEHPFERMAIEIARLVLHFYNLNNHTSTT